MIMLSKVTFYKYFRRERDGCMNGKKKKGKFHRHYDYYLVISQSINIQIFKSFPKSLSHGRTKFVIS